MFSSKKNQWFCLYFNIENQPLQDVTPKYWAGPTYPCGRSSPPQASARLRSSERPSSGLVWGALDWLQSVVRVGERRAWTSEHCSTAVWQYWSMAVLQYGSTAVWQYCAAVQFCSRKGQPGLIIKRKKHFRMLVRKQTSTSAGIQQKWRYFRVNSNVWNHLANVEFANLSYFRLKRLVLNFSC